MPNITPDEQRVLAAALESLLTGSGRVTVLGRELRHALGHLPNDERQRVVDSCVPAWLVRTNSSGAEQYNFTLDGILYAGEPKVLTILAATLGLLQARYEEPGGRRMQLFSWFEITQAAPGISDEDFGLGYQTIFAANIGTPGGEQLGADAKEDPSFKFYVPKDLEQVVGCADVQALQALT